MCYFIISCKKLTTCLCPGKVVISCKKGTPSLDNTPTVTLTKLWEEIYDDDELQSIGLNKNRYGIQSDKQWNVTIPDIKAFAHIYREIFQIPESEYHFFRVKLRNITDHKVTLFIKRFRGTPSDWEFTREKEAIFNQPAVEGVNYIYRKYLIGQGDVTKEQVGLTIESGSSRNPATCIIEEAYYGEQKINILSCCNKRELHYKCYE